MSGLKTRVNRARSPKQQFLPGHQLAVGAVGVGRANGARHGGAEGRGGEQLAGALELSHLHLHLHLHLLLLLFLGRVSESLGLIEPLG